MPFFIKNQNLIANVYLYLDFFSQDKSEFIDVLISEIKKSPLKFAGFKKEKELKLHLKWTILEKGKIKFKKFCFKKIIKPIQNSLKKCNSLLQFPPQTIFIFPTFKNFVKEKMSGIFGFTPSANVFHLFLFPSKIKKKSLEKMVAHELCHSLFFNYQNLNCLKIKKLSEILLFEGLAENFVEEIFGFPNPWAKKVPFKKCKEIFKKIKKFLNSKNKNLYYSLFFEGKKFPVWAGYSLGYQIVRKFIKKRKRVNWENLLKLKIKEFWAKLNF